MHLSAQYTVKCDMMQWQRQLCVLNQDKRRRNIARQSKILQGLIFAIKRGLDVWLTVDEALEQWYYSSEVMVNKRKQHNTPKLKVFFHSIKPTECFNLKIDFKNYHLLSRLSHTEDEDWWFWIGLYLTNSFITNSKL